MRERWRFNADKRAYYYSKDSSGFTYAEGTTPWCSSIEYMRDETNDMKQLGKSLTDIGGPLDQVKIELTMADWTTRYSSYALNGINPGMADVFMPAISGLGTALDAAWANKSLKLLKDVANGSWDTSNKTGTQVDADLRAVSPDWSSSNDLDALGSTAVSRCLPTNPSVDLATGVAELISERKFFSLPGTNQSVSGEWLNWSLGIQPSISMILDLREAMQKSESLLEQYERDAGRLVRRRYRFEPESSSDTRRYEGLMGMGNPNGLNSSITGAGATVTCTYTKTTETWFSGAFTYALPEKGWRRTLAELDQVYGIVPGIDTAWELLPFSFVADYFANMGDVLTNVNAFSTDGLVMPYGYVMQRQKRTWHFDGVIKYRPGGRYSDTFYPQSWKLQQTVNRRRPANPFGFGMSPGDLTTRQLSILAALGINLVS